MSETDIFREWYIIQRAFDDKYIGLDHVGCPISTNDPNMMRFWKYQDEAIAFFRTFKETAERDRWVLKSAKFATTPVNFRKTLAKR